MTQKGSISIYLSILLMSVLMVISSGISILILNQIKMSSQIGYSTISFYAAESGAERCLCDIRKNSHNCTGSCSYTNVSLDFSGDATYTASYSVSTINSKGTFFETNRDIEVNW